jgi:SulP family sulfate permease
VTRLHEQKIELLVAQMKKQFMDTLRRTGVIRKLGEERFFARVEDALEHAWAQLGDNHAATCPLSLSRRGTVGESAPVASQPA